MVFHTEYVLIWVTKLSKLDQWILKPPCYGNCMSQYHWILTEIRLKCQGYMYISNSISGSWSRRAMETACLSITGYSRKSDWNVQVTCIYQTLSVDPEAAVLWKPHVSVLLDTHGNQTEMSRLYVYIKLYQWILEPPCYGNRMSQYHWILLEIRLKCQG